MKEYEPSLGNLVMVTVPYCIQTHVLVTLDIAFHCQEMVCNKKDINSSEQDNDEEENGDNL